MKKSSIVVALVILALMLTQLACGININLPFPTLTHGSGNVISETRPVSDFERIEVDGAGEVTIIQGTSEGLVIEAEDNILPNITSEVRNGTLEIGYEKESWKDSIIPSKTIKYTITVIDLEKITINGAVQLKNASLETDSFDLKVNGAGEFKFEAIKVDELVVDISGGASVNFAGTSTSQEVVINGAGNYEAEDLLSTDTEITFNGAGNASVWATGSLDMEINGAGNIDYYGLPQVTQKITGLGNITHKGDKQP